MNIEARKHSEATKLKISLSKKGNSPAWNKGKKGVQSYEHLKYQVWDAVRREKLAASRRGKKLSLSTRQKMSISGKLRPPKSLETRRKLSIALKGSNHPKWKADRSSLRTKRSLQQPEYRKWRSAVYERDGFTCKMQNSDCKGGLEAHHILRWSEFPDLRWEINNGITLCHFHHPRKKIEENRLSPYFRQLIKIEL